MSVGNIRSLVCDFFGVAILAIIALCLGYLVNRLRDKPLPLVYQYKAERIQQAVIHLSPKPQLPIVPVFNQSLSLQEFREFVEKKQGLVLDARPELFHRIGHVPGARSLPRDDFENSYNHYKSVLEKDKTQPIVVYCADTSCEDSELVRQALVRLHYTHVAIFHGGWAEWQRAGLKEEK